MFVRLRHNSGLLLILAILGLSLPAPAQEPTPAIRVSGADIQGLSVIAVEQLSAGLYRVVYDFSGDTESMEFAAQDEGLELPSIRILYDQGRLAEAALDRRAGPPVFLEWGDATPVRVVETAEGSPPAPEEVERWAQLVFGLAGEVRTRFGLSEFHGRKDDVARTPVRGKEQITVFLPTLSIHGSSYALIAPLTAEMTEIADLEQFEERWIIQVTRNHLSVAKDTVSGLRTRRVTVAWDGAWSFFAEESVFGQPRTPRRLDMSVDEAREVLSGGGRQLSSLRRQFETDSFTIGLARFGTP